MTKSKMYSQEEHDIALLNQKQDQIFQTLVRLESEMKSEFNLLRSEMKEFRGEVRDENRHLKLWSWTQFVFLFGSIAGLTVVMAHGFHWF